MGSPLGLLKPRLMEVVAFAGLRRRSLQRACGGVYDDTSQHQNCFGGYCIAPYTRAIAQIPCSGSGVGMGGVLGVAF